MRLEVPGQIVAGALSVDGKRLAVTTVDPTPHGSRDAPDRDSVSVFGLPHGQVLDRQQIPVRDFAGLVFRGPALFAVDSAADRATGGPDAPLTRVYRFAEDHGPEPPVGDASAVVAMVPRRRGFAGVRADGVLAVYGGDGARYADCPLGADGPVRAGLVAAAEPSSGYIGVADGARVIVVDARHAPTAEVVRRIEAGARHRSLLRRP